MKGLGLRLELAFRLLLITCVVTSLSGMISGTWYVYSLCFVVDSYFFGLNIVMSNYVIDFQFNQILTLINLLKVFISIQSYEIFNKCSLDLSLGSLKVVA